MKIALHRELHMEEMLALSPEFEQSLQSTGTDCQLVAKFAVFVVRYAI
jgi:hypothetical protein